MEGWAECRLAWEKAELLSAFMDDLTAKDCEWRCPKLGAEAIESPAACMPSMCGGSEMLSRGFAESTAVVKYGMSGSQQTGPITFKLDWVN